MSQVAGEITALLQQAGGGDQQARDRLMQLVYRELRRLAGHYMRQERAGHTLQPTALVHEAYLRLFGKRARAKRGGEFHKVRLKDSALLVSDEQPQLLLALDESITRLAALDPRQAEIVEMLYFTGMTQAEAAKALGLSEITVRREWRLARVWLQRELRKGSSRGES
jgi:DNA-directed RNA polymerase specialized sigma24 family protein